MRKKSMTGFAVGVITLLIMLALAGCGRKGGLYLPENVKPDNEKTQSAETPEDNER